MGTFLDPEAGDRAEERSEIQKRRLKDQQQKEELVAAEADDATARRKALAQRGGALSSLLKTSDRGVLQVGVGQNSGG